ncbi:MAG TPA: methyltransferase domain-containing protein [Woeseiaceae bacterium]
MTAARQWLHGGTRLPRRVLPEWLDELPADDPRAVRSRADLRRVNRVMGARTLLLRALDKVAPQGPRRLVELGTGDGTMMLRLAKSRARRWPGVRVTLLDLQPVVSAETLSGIRDLGWSVEVIEADVLDWLARSAADRDAVTFANLFVHHFEGERLARLLAGIGEHSRAFVCCEPRRDALTLAGSHLLGLIGCNDVTRHDAVLSVHAGFRDEELSSAWQQSCAGRWRLEERTAGPFSHLFAAVRET